MSQSSNTNVTPNWILFSFFGTLVCGLIYTIFMQGFLRVDQETRYRNSANIAYEQVKSLKLVFTSFPARNAASINEGQALYASRCGVCHGADLKGMTGNGPSLVDSDWWHVKNPTETEIAAVIIAGVMPPKSRQGVMPARGGGLTDDEIFKVIYYMGSKSNSIEKDAQQ